MDDDRIDH